MYVDSAVDTSRTSGQSTFKLDDESDTINQGPKFHWGSPQEESSTNVLCRGGGRPCGGGTAEADQEVPKWAEMLLRKIEKIESL